MLTELWVAFVSDKGLTTLLFILLSAVETIVLFTYDAFDCVAVEFDSAGWVASLLFDTACPELNELALISATFELFELFWISDVETP